VVLEEWVEDEEQATTGEASKEVDVMAAAD